MRIFLADDHELVVTGITSLIAQILPDVQCRQFANGYPLFVAAIKEPPDLIFLDLDMPEWDGLKTLKELRLKFPELPIVMLSMNDERKIIESCLATGANGFLHKDCNAKELAEAIHTVCGKKEVFLSRECRRILEARTKRIAATESPLDIELTERERDVLELLCQGLTSKEIGEKLFLSARTVETHKKNLLIKFQAHTSGKLIALAIKYKIVS